MKHSLCFNKQVKEAKVPENTGTIQESSKFKKGHSGNPKGKPKGARNKSILAAEALLEGSLDKIWKRVEEEALNENMQAAKMILDRFIPVRKDRVIKIDLPMISTYEDVLLAIGYVVNGSLCVLCASVFQKTSTQVRVKSFVGKF